MNDLAVTLSEYVLPDGWELLPLAGLAVNPKKDIVDGPFGSNLKASEYTESGVPILRLQNVKRNHFLDKNIKYVSEEKYKQLIRHTYKPGDLLITKLGAPLGVACIAPKKMEEGVIVADLVRARLPEDCVDTKYIMYLINSPLIVQQFKENTKGTTRPRVNLKFVRNLQLPVAPYEQQKHIVAKIEELFSHIDAGIAALNKAKQLVKQYRQSVLKAAVTGELTKQWREENKDKLEPASELLERILIERRQKWEEQQLEQFKAKGKMPKGDGWKGKYKEPVANKDKFVHFTETWEIVSVAQLAEIGTGATPLKGKKEYYEDGKVPWVTSGALNDLFVKEAANFITEFALEKTNVSLFPVNTLLVAMYGEGKTRGKVSELLIEAGTNQACAAIVMHGLSEQIRPYVKVFFQKNYNDIRRLSSGGVQPNLNLGIIKETVFPLPPLLEQREIVGLVDNKLSIACRLEADIEQKLIKSEKSKQSILAAAFSGKLIQDVA